MKKYIIKYCPNMTIVKGQDLMCFDVEKMHGVPCQNRTDCLLKQIVELSKDKIDFCEKCSKKADLVYDCIDCNEGGEAHLARAIINFLEIEEVE